MKFNWRSAGELVAVLSVVVSLVFVGYELRMSRSVAVNESGAQRSEIAINLANYLGENSGIWLKGCSGEELSIDEEFQYIQLMGAWDTWNFSRWQRGTSNLFVNNSGRWIRTAAQNLYRYDGFRKYWRIHQALQATENSIDGDPPTSGYVYEVELQYQKYITNSELEMYSVSSCGA